MKIAVDGGALCSKEEGRYGTYSFTENLLRAIQEYDNKNKYSVYTFCKLRNKNTDTIRYKNLQPKHFWMRLRVTLEELFHPSDVFLGLSQAFPTFTKAKCIGFSHGLSFYQYPHLYKSMYGRLNSQLQNLINNADLIVVSSERVKRDFEKIDESISSKIVTIPFGIPYGFETVERRKRKKYFLFVGAGMQIKNIEYLVKAFNLFNEKHKGEYKLYIVGADQSSKNPSVVNIPHTSAKQLKVLYAEATGYLAASLYESFNFPVLEALSQQTPVIGLRTAIIPEFNEYIHLAKNSKEFIKLMDLVAKGKGKKISLSELRKDFSWKRYVEKLLTLYST